MMSLPTSSLAYTDCYEVFEKALDDPKGIRIKCATHNDAVFFRMRLHNARKIMREDNAKTYDRGHPQHGTTEFDKLSVRIRNLRDTFYLYIEHTLVPEDIEKLSDLTEEELRIEATKPLQIAYEPKPLQIESIRRKI